MWFGRQKFEKFLDDDERNAQDLADKILKKILDDDERNEVKRKEKQK
mgnify:CR=1 FL=1